ncbi:MAG: FAD-dependent oxidoreductase, partial [Clostridia bacterium]|nr:FAD-dependent oxidoreductase [Clostridia bacterium]
VQIFHPEYDVPGVGKLIMESMMLKQQGKMAESDEVAKKAYAKLHHDMQFFVTEATVDQLNAIKTAMVESAKRANVAGVDAIEVHGDRLVGSLCSTILNHRTDEYGGAFENRIRFALEFVKALKEAVPEMIIDYKLPVVTPDGAGLRGKGGLEFDEAVKFAKLLEEAGVDMLHVAQANHTGNMNDTIPAMGTREYGFMAYCSEAIKKIVSIPVCVVGRIVTKESAEALIAGGKCDIVAFGRTLLADPDYPNKVASGEPIRYCMSCNKGCTDSITSRSYCQCVLNAENGAEYKRVITKAETTKKVAVVGGGVAGMEAARVAALKGHKVTLFEKSYKLGGQINIASVPPRKSEMLRSVLFFEAELPRLGVEIKLGCEPTIETLNTYDNVIVACGASNITIKVPGYDNSNVVSAWDVLASKAIPFGKVAVIGGGLVGAETAEYLANKGCQVSIVEMLPDIAKGESSTVLPSMKADFAAHGVKEYVNTKLCEIKCDAIVCEDTVKNETVEIPVDFVVMAVGAKKNEYSVEGLNVPVAYVGDCIDRAADISNAIRTAYDAANAI